MKYACLHPFEAVLGRCVFALEGVGDDPFLVGCDGNGVEYSRSYVGVRMKGILEGFQSEYLIPC